MFNTSREKIKASPNAERSPMTDHTTELLAVLKELVADVEQSARDRYAQPGSDEFEQDFQAEDPKRYAVWKTASDAVAKAELYRAA